MTTTVHRYLLGTVEELGRQITIIPLAMSTRSNVLGVAVHDEQLFAWAESDDGTKEQFERSLVVVPTGFSFRHGIRDRHIGSVIARVEVHPDAGTIDVELHVYDRSGR